MFHCQGAGAGGGRKDAADLSCSKTWGRKVMGEGCSYASLCHLCTECPPLHYNINIYAVVPDRVVPGARPQRPHPGTLVLSETQKAVSSVRPNTARKIRA